MSEPVSSADQARDYTRVILTGGVGDLDTPAGSRVGFADAASACDSGSDRDAASHFVKSSSR
jgi:hypothetical protein